MESPFDLTFANGRTAKAVRLNGSSDARMALHGLGLEPGRPTIVLVGGAGDLGESELRRLRPLFAGGLAPLARALGAVVVTGGTQAGVMRLMGEGRTEVGGGFPLVGVAAEGTVALPGTEAPQADAAALNAHHTHFVLVPGSAWGDETPWIARLAAVLAGGAPSVTVLVNGGETAREDVEESGRAGRRILAVAGTGRAADTLAAAARGEASDAQARALAASGLLVATEPDALAGALERELQGR